jgi:hypothetical protein
MEFEKDELVKYLIDNPSEKFDNSGKQSDFYYSIKTGASLKDLKKAGLNVTVATVTMLNQRISDAKNMAQAIEHSAYSEEEKLRLKAYYKNIIQETTGALRDISTSTGDKQLNLILNQATIDHKLVETMYKSSDSISFNELKFAKEMVESWSNFKSVLGIEDVDELPDETREKVRTILHNFSDLSDKTRRIAIELIRKAFDGKITETEITRIVDTSLATEWIRDLTTTGVPIANVLSRLLEETNIKINKERNDIHREIDKVADKLKTHPEIIKNGFDIFFKMKKNKDNTETRTRVSRYSQKFWDSKRANSTTLDIQLKEVGDNKEKVKAAWARYHAWNEANTILFNSLPFINSEDYKDSDREREIENLKNLGFKENEIDNIISESALRYERYLKAKDQYQANMIAKIAYHPELIAEGKTEADWVKEQVEDYDNLYNPLKYVNQKIYGALIVTAKGGAENCYLVPVKNIKGQDMEYYDKQFDTIVNDPVLYEFYSWFDKTIKENLSWYPKEEIEGLGSNYLPIIAEKAAKEYGLSNIKDSVKGLGDWFLNAFTAYDYEQRVETGGMTMKERRNFNATFLHQDIGTEKASKDMILMARAFADMSLIYKHKNTIKAQVDIINDVIQETKGSYKYNKKTGEYIAKAEDAKHIKGLADFTVKKGFYGISDKDMADEALSGDTLFYDWKELVSGGLYKSEKAKKAKAIEDKIKKVNEQLDKENITEKDEEVLTDALYQLKKEHTNLGGRKFSLSQMIDSSLTLTRATSLTFNVASAVRNLLVGKLNNWEHAKGGRDYTTSDLAIANRLIASSIGKYWSGGKYETRMTHILFKVLSDSGLLEGEDHGYVKSLVDNRSNVDKFKAMLPKGYTLLQSGDYHFKSELMMAGFNFTKVETSKGQKSLHEVLDEDGKYDEKEFGPWDAEKNGGKTFDELYTDTILKYRQLAKKLHGAVGKDIYLKAKGNSIGRLFMVFKSWLPETIGVRFDPKHIDGIMNREEEGFYRTFVGICREKGLGTFKLMLDAVLNRDVDISDEMKLANFKKAVAEIQVIITLMLAYTILSAISPTDKKDKKMYNLFVLRQLKDLQRDMTYYIDIRSANDLQKNVVPILITYQNMGKAFNAFGQHILGVEKPDGKLKYDNERTALAITKVLPVLSNVNRVIYYTKEIQ